MNVKPHVRGLGGNTDGGVLLLRTFAAVLSPRPQILKRKSLSFFVESQFPNASRRELELKGKSGPVVARVIAAYGSPVSS